MWLRWLCLDKSLWQGWCAYGLQSRPRVLAATCGAAFCDRWQPPDGNHSPGSVCFKVGDKAPDFTLKNQVGS